MEKWLLASILAYTIWSVIILLEKYYISHQMKNSYTLAVCYGLISGPCAAIVSLWGGASLMESPQWSLLAFLTGAGMFGFLFLVFRSFETHAATKVLLLLQVTPLGVLPISWLFLSESLSTTDLMAFFLLVMAGVFAVHKKGAGRGLFRGLSSVWYALVLKILVIVFTKFIYTKMSFYSGFFWLHMGEFFAAIVLFAALKEKVYSDMRAWPKKIALYIIGVVSLEFLARIIFNYAMFSGPVSLIMGVGSMLPVLSFALAVIISWNYPHLLKEDLSKEVLLKKSLALGLTVIAIWMIHLL